MELANDLGEGNAIEMQNSAVLVFPEENKKCEILTFQCIMAEVSGEHEIQL